MKNSKKIIILVVTFLFLISATLYAASQSLPGETLYGVKTRVIEPTILTFHFGDTAKQTYLTHLLQKRITEVRQLENQDEISEQAKTEVSDASQRIIEKLEEYINTNNNTTDTQENDNT